MVRGTDARNPLLLILHGGPGFAEMPLFSTYNADLEARFLVVHWDQRGAGMSYSATIPVESMTIRQFVSDTRELIDWLTDRFGQNKIYLVGHSWGSLVGATVACEHPAQVHAFLGVGQFVAGLRNEQLSYALTMRRAIESENNEAINALRAIEDRYTPSGGLTFADLVLQRGWLDRFGGQTHGDTGALFDRIEPELRGQYFGDHSEAAQKFSFDCLLKELLSVDLRRTTRTFDVPVHFAVGRHDQNTPAELAVEYFEVIEAPAKELHWFENSAHMIPYEEPAKFNALLTDIVLDRR